VCLPHTPLGALFRRARDNGCRASARLFQSMWPDQQHKLLTYAICARTYFLRSVLGFCSDRCGVDLQVRTMPHGSRRSDCYHIPCLAGPATSPAAVLRHCLSGRQVFALWLFDSLRDIQLKISTPLQIDGSLASFPGECSIPVRDGG